MAGYRGRLIYPFIGRFALMDAAATAQDPDGSGQLSSGFDDVFRETVMMPAQNNEPYHGVDSRKERLVDIPFQEDSVRVYDGSRNAPFWSGASPDADGWILLHFRDLEALGLVDATSGEPLIHREDRLVSVHTHPTGELLQTIRSPPGLYVRTVLPNFGLRGTRNILFLRLQARDLGSATQGG
jgi:hypothetical protein